ncbi:MAG TPA: hypothetical protein PLF61_05840 [Candidatus Goldiibacteriota bacterium]|nr:hypothetical protein [Candidatus Goldiibacteriota bacterium]
MAEYTVYSTSLPVSETNIRNLAAIRDRVLKNLGSDSDFYPNDLIDEYIVMGFNHIAEEVEMHELSDEQTTQSGIYLYDIPDETIQINTVLYDNKVLIKKEKKEILKLYNGISPENITGTPEYFCRENLTQIRLYPTPSAEKTLTINYSSYPTDLTNDSDISQFLRRADFIAECFATFMLKYQDGETDMGARYERLYYDNLTRLKMVQIDMPQFIVKEDE